MAIQSLIKYIIVVCGALIALWLPGAVEHSPAQSDTGPWSVPTNVSGSGAASMAVVAVAPDDAIHVVWWDSVTGEQYARTNITGTGWTKPVVLPEVYLERRVNTDSQNGKVDVVLVPPNILRLVSTTMSGTQSLFWINARGDLLQSLLSGSKWGRSAKVGEGITQIDVMPGISDTLHLLYIRSADTPELPAGIYYRFWNGVAWKPPVLVNRSLYYRTLKLVQAHVRVVGDAKGEVIAVWDDPHLGTSFYARSDDGGVTWSNPEAVNGTKGQPVTQARVAYAPNGDFVLMWQYETASGCSIMQQRSQDSGRTWGTPGTVLGGLRACPVRWTFGNLHDGRLWWAGTYPANNRQADNEGLLAALDDQGWTEPVVVSLKYETAKTTQQDTRLACLGFTPAGTTVAVAGCDPNGDVWIARNVAQVEQLLPALKPPWRILQVLSPASERNSSDTEAAGTDAPIPVSLPALAIDTQGSAYALWRQNTSNGKPYSGLFAAVRIGGVWSRASEVIPPPTDAQPESFGQGTKLESPSLALDRNDRLQVAWVDPVRGQIQYTWAYSRDVMSAHGWAHPVGLSPATQIASQPQIIVDPRVDSIYLAYAVPFNENRGIYLLRSDDGGATWVPPSRVFDAAAAGWDTATKPHLALDLRTNVLHMVWLRASLAAGNTTSAIIYSSSADKGASWSTPVEIATGALDWPHVALVNADEAYVSWNAKVAQAGTGALIELWGQWTHDGGHTWTEPASVPGFKGITGPAGLVANGSGRLFAVAIGQGSTNGSTLFYSSWDGKAWSLLEPDAQSQPAMPGNAVTLVMNAQTGELSTLVRAWMWLLDGTGEFAIMATGRIIPALAKAPAPMSTPLPVAVPTAVPTIVPTPTPQLQIVSTAIPLISASDAPSSQMPLMLSGAVVAVVILGISIAIGISRSIKH